MSIFTTLDKVDPTYGGKSMGLKKLISAGLNVPQGIAITPQNLHECIKGENISELKKVVDFFGPYDLLAVRSSAINEDGSQQSYAGQYKSILNVKNNIFSIMSALLEVYQSSLSKEIQNYSGNNQDSMGIVIQKMIKPKYAGVMFTEATDLNGDNCCLIEMVKGLGEQLVSGHSKTSRIIIPYRISHVLDFTKIRIEGEIKDINIAYALKESIIKINNFFKKGMDIEWCIDEMGLASIVQARPITKHILIPEINTQNGLIASIGKCKAKSFVIDSDLEDEELLETINSFPQGSILIAPYTDTQYMPAINRAVGIITEEGSILSHAAIISREKGIPCVVGFKDASKIFPTGTEITLNTASSEIISNNYNSSFDNRDIDWESIYVFENVLQELTIDNCRVIVEKSPFNNGEIAIHTPYDVTSRQYNEIEYYCRKHYHQPVKFIASEKYLWFDEVKRFSNFSIFKRYLELSQIVCHNQNIDELNNLYDSIVNDVCHILDSKRRASDPFEVFKFEEEMAALHLIADSIVPDGYGIFYVYKKVSHKKDVNFKDFLNGHFDSSDLELKNCYNFFTLISHYRNTICQQLVDLGAYSFDYFDDREDRAKRAIKNPSSEKPVDTFYKMLKKNLNKDKSLLI